MLEFGAKNEEINQYCRLAPFAISVNENSDNELSIIIAFPAPINDKPDYDNQRINEILSNTNRVGPDLNRMYEIRFERYIIYQCRNESYTCWDASEIRKGEYLIIFEKSKLLDYYENVIFDFDRDCDKPNRKHYGIYTENHIIDVIANEPPVIKKLNSNLSEEC